MQIFKPHEGLPGVQHGDWSSLNHPSNLKSRRPWGGMYFCSLSEDLSEKNKRFIFLGTNYFFEEFQTGLNVVFCGVIVALKILIISFNLAMYSGELSTTFTVLSEECQARSSSDTDILFWCYSCQP